ncbi:MAG: capreomycidine hydroxylase [Desulfuromonas sp.]|nr:MAG: capreomycidine hydroxylase [Desulfuromonas sp.]
MRLILLLFILFAPLHALAVSPAAPAPFGADLFQGNFAKTTYDELNSDYRIMPGDRVAVRLWGARTFEGVLNVDARGNLFLPEVGPVAVEGLRHADLQYAVLDKVQSVYKQNVEVYTNLLNSQPVAVFVTGFVSNPGRYAGGSTDSVLYYLDQAGGIDTERGSYRNIRILRDGKQLQSIDLYPFILEGVLPRPRLEDGDLILVGPRGAGIVAEGQVRHHARFEFSTEDQISGQQLTTLAMLQNKASHASVIGTRNGAPHNAYLPLDEFYGITLQDGDRIEFHADIPGETIMVAASGAIVGASRYPVHKSTRLQTVMELIPVEPELANLSGVHIKRRSVAKQQKKALEEALQRLEKTALTATSQGVEEANIRVREAELITQFVAKAREVEPDGTVVVEQNGELADIYLENGDVVVIPPKSDVILISGEVLVPQAVVYTAKMDYKDYIDNAGGYTRRADKKHVLVVKPNGAVLNAGDSDISAGDHLLVLPKIDTKNMQVLKDISQILYQVAVAAKVALDL